MRTGFELPLMDGGAHCFEVANAGESTDQAMMLFDEACAAISEEWRCRKHAGADAHRWLSVVAYQLIGRLVAHGHSGVISQRLRNWDRKELGKEDVSTIFQRGLLAIFAHKAAVNRESHWPDEQFRNRLGPRLWFAFRHYVPHEFLMGFLSDYGARMGNEKHDPSWTLPELRTWIVLHRAQDENPLTRGIYHDDIEKLVKGAQSLMECMR